MSANIFQRQLMARRLLWIMVGPGVLERLRFPWHKLASRPLPKGWLGTVKPPPPEPKQVPVILEDKAEPEPIVKEPPEPPEPVILEEKAEPEPVIKKVKAEPEPIIKKAKAEPEPIILKAKPKPKKRKPFKPPPIFVTPWEPGPARSRTPSSTGERNFTIYGKSGDGMVVNVATNWDDCRNEATGNEVDINDIANELAMSVRRTATNTYVIYRSFFYFDLSGLPHKAIKEAYFYLTNYSKRESSISIQQGTQADVLTVADFSKFTGEYFAAGAMASGINIITLNATGKTYLRSVLGGTAKLCGREYAHDYTDNTIPTITNYRNGCVYQDWSTEKYRPYLLLVM